MYCQLGTTIFDGLKSFVTFSTQEDATIVEHALINRKPRLQGAGIGLVNLSLSLFLHAEFCNVKDELAKLRTSKDSFEVLPLLWGNGDVEGDFVIISLNRDIKQQDGTGNFISATVSVSLKEFVKEAGNNPADQQAKSDAFATGDKQPATKSTRVNPVPCNSFASKQMSLIQSNGAKVDGYMRSYSTGSTDNTFALTNIAAVKSQTSTLSGKLQDPSYPCLNNNPAAGIACTKIISSCDYLTSTIQKNELIPGSPDKISIDLYNTSLQAGIKQLAAALSKNIQASAIRK